MKKPFVKILSLGLVAAVVALIPITNHAGTTTNTPSLTPPKKSGNLPLVGSVKAVDLKAETVTIGKKTYALTADTKITKGNKTPAKLSDLTVGALVTGFYTRGADGKLTAISLKINAPDKTKKKKATATNVSTNSVSN